MKLLKCNKCYHIFSLSSTERNCDCKSSGGYYLENGLNAVYWGDSTPIGFANNSIINAINNQPKSGMGMCFEAFVIPINCNTFLKIKK